MTNVEHGELPTTLCNICDWRASSCEDQTQRNLSNLEKRKVALLARALREKLPGDFRHVICKPLPNEYAEPDVCVLRTNCKTKEDVDTWVSMYSGQSGFKWDLQPRSVSFNRKVKELHRCKYVCHEPIFKETLPGRPTTVQQCPASITVVIKSANCEVTDEHINSFPTVVRLRGDHSCFTGRLLRGEIKADRSVLRSECEIHADNLLQTTALPKENGTAVVKKLIEDKKDPLSVGRNVVTITKVHTKHNAKKKESSLKKGPDLLLIVNTDAVGKEGKVTTNNSLILCKENTSKGLLKGTTVHKETVSNTDNSASKVKITHGKINGRLEIEKVPKKPLISVKSNRNSVPTKVSEAGNPEAQNHSEGKSPTKLVKVNGNAEERKASSLLKINIQGATKRKHEETNGQQMKNKKPRVEERQSSDKHVHRIEACKKMSPKKTFFEEKAIPVGHTMECLPQVADDAMILKANIPSHPKTPPKVVSEPVKYLFVTKVDKFQSLTSKFDDLFAQSHEPATALATHIVDLQMSEGNNWRNVACPDISWCQSRFDRVVCEPLITTPQTTLSALSELSALCSPDNLCRMERLPGGGFVGIVVTALMRRNAETNPAAAGVNYVLPYLGTTSQLYLVMCDSEGGGLPLAIMITSDATPEVFAAAVRLLAANTSLSPRQWLVPDSQALCKALSECFPDSRVNLCLSLLLKDVWLHAVRESSRIPESHQVLLYQFVVHMMRCPSELLLVYQKQMAIRDMDRPFVEYLNTLYNRRAEWATYLREPAFQEITLETEIAISKSSVFSRLHDFDTVHLVHFALTRLDKWYELRVRGFQSIDQPATFASMPSDVKLTTLWDGVRLVQEPSEGVDHLVNDNVGCCSCLKGNPGWCQHQLAVSLTAEVDQLPVPVNVVRLVPQGHKDSVQVDTSTPEIFPSAVMNESPGVWGTPVVEGKRVRKLPTKLKVDLGEIGPKKQKVEKDKKVKGAGVAMPTMRVDAVTAVKRDDGFTKDSVCVQAVKKVPEKEKIQKTPEYAPDNFPGYGITVTVEDIKDVEHGKKKLGHTPKKIVTKKKKTTKMEVPGTPVQVSTNGPINGLTGNKKERGDMDSISERLKGDNLPGKKLVKQRSSDSGGSQSKSVHFSPLVEKKTQTRPEDNVHKLIKFIKRDLLLCYAQNPGLKDKICDLYRAMNAPVSEPLSILKQKLESRMSPVPTPPQKVKVTVQDLGQVSVNGPEKAVVKVPYNVVVEVPAVEQEDIVEDEEAFLGFDPNDVDSIADIVGVTRMDVVDMVVEETVSAVDDTSVPIDIQVNPCFVSLSVLDVKYKRPDGSYSSLLIYG